MKEFLYLFKKVGGKEILRQYWHAHVLLYAVIQMLCQGFSKKSLEIVRLSVDNRILAKLRRKYRKFIEQYMKAEDELCRAEHAQSKKVWVCWLQGIENAPLIVQMCIHSLKENLPDREIILITEENYKKYVSFPEHIQKKIDTGVISKTHMSDLLRLELLITHGGTWMDATVFCSGQKVPSYILDSQLFVFQCLKPGLDGHCTGISSWLMTACSNHPILLLTRALLYKYWENHNTLIDYYLIHDMFQLAIETYPEEWKAVVPFCNSVPHILLLRFFEKYDDEMWQAIKQMTCIHKLSYKFTQEQFSMQGTYYEELINDFKRKKH